jgi:hypothetical protein
MHDNAYSDTSSQVRLCLKMFRAKCPGLQHFCEIVVMLGLEKPSDLFSASPSCLDK